MTKYTIVKCEDCGGETMVPEDAPLKCDHCGSINVKVTDTIMKDMGFRP